MCAYTIRALFALLVVRMGARMEAAGRDGGRVEGRAGAVCEPAGQGACLQVCRAHGRAPNSTVAVIAVVARQGGIFRPNGASSSSLSQGFGCARVNGKVKILRENGETLCCL